MQPAPTLAARSEHFLVCRIYPFQRPQCEEKDIYALLFLKRPRVGVEIQKPLLQTRWSESGLKSGICMPGGYATVVNTVIFGLGKFSDLFLIGFSRSGRGFPRQEIEGLTAAHE